jgi:hypothetical protein
MRLTPQQAYDLGSELHCGICPYSKHAPEPTGGFCEKNNNNPGTTCAEIVMLGYKEFCGPEKLRKLFQ